MPFYGKGPKVDQSKAALLQVMNHGLKSPPLMTSALREVKLDADKLRDLEEAAKNATDALTRLQAMLAVKDQEIENQRKAAERERAALLAIKYRDQKRIVTDEAALTSKREDVNVMRISSGRFGLEVAGTLAEARRQHVRRHKC